MAFGARNSRRLSFGLSLSDAARAWLARTTALSSLYRNAGASLINGLLSDGLLAPGKLSLLQNYATQDETNALLNMVSSSYTGTVSGSPTFTAGGGYTTASTKYIDTGFAFNGDANYTQNAASIFVWSGSSGTSTHSALATGAAAGSQQTTLLLRNASDQVQTKVNDNTYVGTTANTDGSGFFTGVRIDASNKVIYKDGLSLGTIARASLALQAANLQSGGNNATAGNQYAGIIRCIGAGGLLTATDNANLFARMRAYMTAVGVSGN